MSAFKGWKRVFLWVPCLLVCSLLLLVIIREVGVAYNKFPCELIENPPAAKTVLDRYGNVIWAQTNKDQNWQIPVKLQEMSPWIIKATICAEDSRFYEHSGVDDIAVLRAGLRSLAAGRLKSGASTLTMQLVKMAHLKGNSFSYKFKQMSEAISLERQRSKEWILEHYLNYAPYGSNIIGIEAASRFYFRKKAIDLNLYEASLLAGLPQAPSVLRPDRHPAKALLRQQYVLKRMLTEGAIEKLPELRLFVGPEKRKNDCRLGVAQTEEHVANMLKGTGEVTSCIDSEIQQKVKAMTKAHLSDFLGIDSAALVVIDNRTSEVRALVNCGSGKTNSALSPRSSGSVLKPFIYLSLIEQGTMTAVSKLDDRKLHYKDYNVRNFSGHFKGAVSVREALTSSLNTPAVQSLQKLGVNEFLGVLKQVGFTSLNKTADKYGLSLALGGGEVSLLELTNAYACLSRTGQFRKYSLMKEDSKAQQLFDPGSVEIISSILRSEAIGPGTLNKLSWKTGTSNGFRDAWCVAYNDELTIGVWLGNQDGSSNSKLIGSVAAAPLVHKVFNDLYPSGLPQAEKSIYLQSQEVCSTSGLRLVSHCKDVVETRVSINTTLTNCQQCESPSIEKKQSSVSILSPIEGVYKSIDKVRLELKSSSPGSWFINGEYIGKGNRWHDFEKGHFKISCVVEEEIKSTELSVK